MIASSYLFLVRGGRILLLRRFNTGYQDGKYSVPAGHVEEGETLTGTLIREVKEEIGIEVKARDIRLVHVMHRKETDIRMDFFFTVTTWRGLVANREPEKCDDLRWFPLDNLPWNTIPYIRRAIGNWQKRIGYSEIGWQ